MHFAILLTHRRGRALNRTAILRSESVIGDLRIVWEKDREHDRLVKRAVLLTDDLGAGLRNYLLPPLHEPEVLAMSSRRFSIAGYELIDGAAYRQSWLVETSK